MKEITYPPQPHLRKLRSAYEKRYRNLRKRTKTLNLSPPEKEQLWKKVLKTWNTGFTCQYCHKRVR